MQIVKLLLCANLNYGFGYIHEHEQVPFIVVNITSVLFASNSIWHENLLLLLKAIFWGFI